MAIDARTIRRIAGELDDSAVAAIAATGIDEAGLREARLRVTEGEEMPSLEVGGSAAVHEVVLLLERLELDEQVDDLD